MDRKEKTKTDKFDTEIYENWRNKRLNFIVETLGEDFFKGKTLLEVGAGYGQIGNFFSEKGAKVTCSDAREEHIKVINERYPHIKTYINRLEKLAPSNEFNNYDIVIHMGVLYHLKCDIKEAIKKAVLFCKLDGILVLECNVLDSSDPTKIKRKYEEGFDQSFYGRGYRPSAALIEEELNKYTTFVRYDSSKLDCSGYNYSWEITNSGKSKPSLRRFWVAKRIK